MSTFGVVAVDTVLSGSFIPAHDQTFDLAAAIGGQLDQFRAYVTEVRDPAQAADATEELLTAFLNEAQKRDAPQQ